MASGFYPENPKLGEILQTICTNGHVTDKGYVAHYAVGDKTGPAASTTNVALGTATDMLSAADNSVAINTGTFLAQPDVPRSVVFTPSGTTANVTAVSATVTGTDINDQALVEVLPAFVGGAATAKESLGAFKTVTNVSIPINGASVTMGMGFGAKLGLPDILPHNTVIAAVLNGVREATAPTVTVHATILAQNTCKLNSALAAHPVDIYYIV